MFLGEYSHNIDSKGRLTIPAKFRGALATGLVVTRGFDQNLMVYSLAEWNNLAAKIAAQPLSDERVRAFRRRVFSGATDLTPDRQGRILVPKHLRDFADINGEVIIAGMFDYVEIWGVKAWQAVREAAEGTTQQWADLGI